MKRLMVFRHGKSDWYAGASSDHQRPLNKRGVRSAKTMGKVLTRLTEAPDLIYASSAVRARDTARLAAEAGGWDCDIIEADELYGTSAGDALSLVRGVTDDVQRLMVVGHQPTWGYLVQSLTGASVHMKTATVAAVDLAIDAWRGAPTSTGTLAYLLQPRMFKDWDL